eukprot:scaffold564_cov248-Pinguiococcus_pyrenoidosus.AAC.25
MRRGSSWLLWILVFSALSHVGPAPVTSPVRNRADLLAALPFYLQVDREVVKELSSASVLESSFPNEALDMSQDGAFVSTSAVGNRHCPLRYPRALGLTPLSSLTNRISRKSTAEPAWNGLRISARPWSQRPW